MALSKNRVFQQTARRILTVVLLISLLFIQPVYALPVTVIDPTKRFFTYDPNGNLVEELAVGTGARTLYAYDALNRLKEVSRIPSAGSSAQVLASATYDGEGKRISSTEGGVTTTYLYDGLLPVLERQGSSTTINVWGLSLGGGVGGLLCRYDPRSANPDSRFLYPLYDGSGNILAWTDSTGAVVSTTSYTAFGEVLSQSGASQAVGFSTKAFSSTTGLSYFGARYYSPALARWLTPDPLGMVDGPNLYAYVRNSPLNFTDPFGLKGFLRISVIRSGGGSLDGHAWITYTDDKGRAQTFGTYGRTDLGIVGLQENREQGWIPDVSLNATLDDEQEQALLQYITDPDANRWGFLNNCSSFACNAWVSAGQSPLSNRNWVGIPNPNSLANSIERRARGQQSQFDPRGLSRRVSGPNPWVSSFSSGGKAKKK